MKFKHVEEYAEWFGFLLETKLIAYQISEHSDIAVPISDDDMVECAEELYKPDSVVDEDLWWYLRIMVHDDPIADFSHYIRNGE